MDRQGGQVILRGFGPFDTSYVSPTALCAQAGRVYKVSRGAEKLYFALAMRYNILIGSVLSRSG
jgi:hypothetical protein